MSASEVRRCSSTSDPVADLEAGFGGELGVGSDSDPDEDHVGLDPAPVVQNDTGHGPIPAGQFGHRNLAAQVHAVVTVQVSKDGCGLGAEDAQQRQLGGFEEGHVKSRVAGGGGGLQPDPAGADDRDPARLGEPGLDAVTVLDAAQVVHAVEVGTWQAEASRCRTRWPAAACRSPAVAPVAVVTVRESRVERGHRGAQAQLDRVVGVPGLRMDEDAVAVGVALEVVLGQGRAFVGTVRLVAEQGDPPVEAFLAQGLRRDGARPGRRRR